MRLKNIYQKKILILGYNMEDEFKLLFKTVSNRIKQDKSKSYTKKLIKEGPKKISQKLGEECTELIVDYLKGSKKRTVEEAVDVIYHLVVLLNSKKISINDIYKEIRKRKNV
ncbi:MAG: phosphoribosyl-ATP diphosphatase [Pelagibacteraceae bacterium]|nr:phosphoribosyl-ATP diphosphatase [Pelagibacteraceae bacterium]